MRLSVRLWRGEWRLSQQKPPATETSHREGGRGRRTAERGIQRHSICAFFPINCFYVGVRFANVNKSRGPEYVSALCPKRTPHFPWAEATTSLPAGSADTNICETHKRKKNVGVYSRNGKDIDSSMGFN